MLNGIPCSTFLPSFVVLLLKLSPGLPNENRVQIDPFFDFSGPWWPNGPFDGKMKIGVESPNMSPIYLQDIRALALIASDSIKVNRCHRLIFGQKWPKMEVFDLLRSSDLEI